MKLFSCPSCRQPLHFENSLCTKCGHALAFVPEHLALTALEPVAKMPGTFVALGLKDKGARYRLCGNQIDHQACNLNELIPNLADAAAAQAWIMLEGNKRRLIYTLLALGLPVEQRAKRPEGLAFAF